MNQLKELLYQIESYIPHFEKSAPNISQSTVGWQLDHSLLVINSVMEQLKNSNPQQYQWKFKWIRLYIQITNTIPRGKVKAPKLVRPVATASLTDLQSNLTLARNNIALLDSLPKNSFFTHPFFGDLNLKATVWFLKLHTKHHLKIVNDIINKG